MSPYIGAPFALSHFALISASITLCVFLLMLFWTRRDEPQIPFLAIFFGANLIDYLDELFWISNSWLHWPQLTNLYIPFLYAMAPAMYRYTQVLSDGARRPSSWPSKHWLACVLAALLCLPYYLLDPATKLARLKTAPGSLEHLHLITLGPTIALTALLPFSMIYLGLCLRLLRRHLRRIKAFFSNIEDKDLSWLRWSILLLLLGFGVSAVQLLSPSRISDSGPMRDVFLGFGLLWLMVFGVLSIQQQAVRGATDVGQAELPEPEADTGTDVAAVSESADEVEKYQRSQLSHDDAERIQRKLIQAMEEQQLQLDANLTLRKLADATGISENRISQVLNTRMQQGFYDFVNSWRIRQACVEMQRSSRSILEIAYGAGFNSRSTFNQAFKKHTGQTPSAYRRSMMGDG